MLERRILRLLLVIVGALAVVSMVAHVFTQQAVDTAFQSRPGLAPRLYELLAVQTWLQASVLGALLALVGYFLILPMIRRVEQKESELEAKEEALEFAKSHDPVTGFLDRRHFYELLEHTGAVGDRYDHTIGLLRLQIPGFRDLWSRLDLKRADALVVEIAGRIERMTRASDRLARLGDDEFAILVPEVKTVEGLGRLADRLIEEVSETAGSGREELAVGCSIGIAVVWPGEPDCAGHLLHRSAQALDGALSEPGSTWRYHPTAIQGLDAA